MFILNKKIVSKAWPAPLVKKLNILNANYLFVGDNKKQVILNINYSNNKFNLTGDKNSPLFKQVEKKAKDLLKRKSRVNLV